MTNQFLNDSMTNLTFDIRYLFGIWVLTFVIILLVTVDVVALHLRFASVAKIRILKPRMNTNGHQWKTKEKD